MSEPVMVSGARTPVGRLLGSLKDFTATDLGGFAIKAALERAGISGSQVDYVIMGQVLQAGAGQIPSRQAAVKAGIPMTVPSITINKVCLSGLDAIALAAQLIRAGEFDVVVAGGMESMTNAPHLLPGARSGYRYGSVELADAMALDGLTDAFDHLSMGESTERHNARFGIGRAEQDDFAARSHQRAAAAAKNGLFADEIVAVQIPQRRGEPVTFDHDEGIRPDTSAEALSRLRPAFGTDGTITAGSASQISDGACAVVVMSAPRAADLRVGVLAELGSHGNVAARPRRRAGAGQRQRRRDRDGPSDRCVGRPDRAAPGQRAAAARRRPGRGGALRGRRPGRCPAAARARGLVRGQHRSKTAAAGARCPERRRGGLGRARGQR